MVKNKFVEDDQESLADALFPQESVDEAEEAILSIPPQQRVLRTEQYDFSVNTLISMMEKGEVTIPEFQRRYVWTDRQASRLIESLIIQVPIPVIYLNQEKDESFSVIDGNQRLNSLRRFLLNEFYLTGLTSYPELTGLNFSQLDKRFQRHISNRVLRCTVILKETHPQVKFDVFERLNSGAVALTRQELRHGLYYGTLLAAAAEVVKSIELEKHLGKRPDRRMKAEELVIRFWALNKRVGHYEKPLATFISAYAEQNRNPSKSDLNKLKDEVVDAHKRVEDIFGRYAFTFEKDGRARFNAAVYDAQMIACARLTPERAEELTVAKKQVQAAYASLQEDPVFARYVTLATSDKAALQGRITTVNTLLKSV